VVIRVVEDYLRALIPIANYCLYMNLTSSASFLVLDTHLAELLSLVSDDKLSSM